MQGPRQLELEAAVLETQIMNLVQDRAGGAAVDTLLARKLCEKKILEMVIHLSQTTMIRLRIPLRLV